MFERRPTLCFPAALRYSNLLQEDSQNVICGRRSDLVGGEWKETHSISNPRHPAYSEQCKTDRVGPGFRDRRGLELAKAAYMSILYSIYCHVNLAVGTICYLM